MTPAPAVSRPDGSGVRGIHRWHVRRQAVSNRPDGFVALEPAGRTSGFMRPSRRRPVNLRGLSFVLFGTVCCVACNDEATAPARFGTVRVSLSMTGIDLPGFYSVLVGGRSVLQVAGAASQVSGLLPGTYDLTLSVRRNCQVDGENPRPVTVEAGETTALSFSITCGQATGHVRVTTVTTGVDIDPNGYELRVTAVDVDGKNATEIWRVDATGTQTLSPVPIGDATLTLTGLSVNCDPAGPSLRTVTVAPAETVTVAFSVVCASAAGQIAYVVGVPPDIRHIYLVNVSGAGARRLTADQASSDEDPAWSPDGNRIAFTSDRSGNPEIYVADADGSNVLRLTNNPAADYQPTWSPDGARIAFVSERSGNADLFAVDLDGTNPVRLTTSASRDVNPAWSRDGRIAFTSDRDGRAEIYVINGDGAEARLTTSGGSQAAWSPDGTRLAYTAPQCSFYGCYPLIVIEDSTSALPPRVIGPAEHPTWSPDGSKIAYSAFDCDFYYVTCRPNMIRIHRLGSPDVIPLAAGVSPAWRP